jgi:hypothetical protein
VKRQTKIYHNQNGASIIAAIFIIVVLAFMSIMFVSMIGTDSMTSINDLQAEQAFSVAEGGIEFILKNRSFPDYSTGAAGINLGTGNFSVSTPTYLTADPGAAGTTITVQSTANFPASGRITIDSELMDYTGSTATTFTGAARGAGGTIAVAHPAGRAVYPVTSVADNPLAAGSTTINVSSTRGFRVPGVIIIDVEYIYCTGTNVANTQFTSCTRGFKGSVAASHPNLSGVFQYSITSTGTVGSAQRAVTRSVMSQSAGAMMVYAKGNGNGTPYYRRWDGSSWGSELTAQAVPADIRYIVLKFARTRNEAVLGTLSSNGDIRVQVWNGTGWGATTLVGNTTAANSAYRGFDVEYETSGDRAMVVYNRNVANQVSYRIWNGSAWTAQANQNLASVSIGVPRWIEIARNPLSVSNEIAMIVLGSANVYVYGLRWTGAAWNNMGVAAAWTTAASLSTYKAIHVAYEQQSGRALFVWATNTNRFIGYRIWDGASLLAFADQIIANLGNDRAWWMRLAPDPYSDNIMLGMQDDNADLTTSLWNGAAWDPNGTSHDNSVENTSRSFDLVYETFAANSGRAWLLWGDGNFLSRKQWDGAAWGGAATTGDDTSFVNMVAHPVSGAVLSGIYESVASATDDIWESHLTQGSAIWSPRVMIWGGQTVAAPVMERLSLAAERYTPLSSPLILLDWNEVVR